MKMTPLKKQSKNEQRKYYSSKRGSYNPYCTKQEGL